MMKPQKQRDAKPHQDYRDADVRLRSQYIGVVSLLGRISARLPKGDEAHFGIGKAMRDANNYLLATNSDILFDKSSSGGYSVFMREAVAENRKRREEQLVEQLRAEHAKA